MATTYDKIATTTVAVAASTITFSSISSAYTDLRLVLVFTQSIGSGQASIQFNTDTGFNYSYTRLAGNGTAANSGRVTGGSEIIINDDYNIGASTTIPTLSSVDIFSYAGSTNKTVLINSAMDLNGSGTVWNAVGLWRNTAAINRIDISGAGSIRTFSIGTSATLYGILKA
jgi:hypothetical protein